MARLTRYPAATFVATEHISRTLLVDFDSLFTPERRLWAAQQLRRFHGVFVGRFDEGEGSFLDKYRRQLDGADDDVLQLAAEIFYVQQFFTSLTGPAKKIENVQTVLSWCSRPVPIPQWAVEGLEAGLAGDQSFNNHRPYHIGWLAEFVIHWQALDGAVREQLLRSPWDFARKVRSVEFARGHHQPMREALLYLVFPDQFESISSTKHKKTIREAFRSLLPQGPTGDIDADILTIREALTKEQPQGFSFYRTPVIERWQKVPAPPPPPPPPSTPTMPATPPGQPRTADAASFLALGQELFLDPPEAIAQWAELLLDSRQLIFQGPPGTGKTFIARKLARLICGSDDAVTIVQFHPSYAYEDFVEGYRPVNGRRAFAPSRTGP